MKPLQILAMPLLLVLPVTLTAETPTEQTVTPDTSTEMSVTKDVKESKKPLKKRKMSKKRKYRMENHGKGHLKKAEMLEKKRSRMTDEERTLFDKKMADRKAKKEAFKKMSPESKKAFIAEKHEKRKAMKQGMKDSGMVKKDKKMPIKMKPIHAKKQLRSH